MVCIFCVNPEVCRLERLPVMIVIHRLTRVMRPVVTGCETGRVATVCPRVGGVPSVSRPVGQEGAEGCRWRGLARVMVGHLVGVAVIVTGVVRVEMWPLGGGRGRGQGLLALVTVNLTGGRGRSSRSHQVVSHLPWLLHTGALLLLPPYDDADDDADEEDDHHHREADDEDQDKGRLRSEGLGLCDKIFDKTPGSPRIIINDNSLGMTVR